MKTQSELQQEQSQRLNKEKQLTIADKEKKLQAVQMKLQQTQLTLKDKKLSAQKVQQLFFIGGIVLLALLSFFIYRNFRNQQKANKTIALEKKKSDELLLNILPSKVADEIKQSGTSKAQTHSNVTVLFTDFVNFTSLSKHFTAQQIVLELDRCFGAFDNILDKYGMEKIKTIGDAYMAASGIPTANEQHASIAVKAALEMNQYVKTHGPLINNQRMQMRLGINSGSVVAGIVGLKKFAYDIWGNTVNTAARLEQYSEPEKINISRTTYDLIRNEFNCIHRGKIYVKNEGEIDMYFISELNDEIMRNHEAE